MKKTDVLKYFGGALKTARALGISHQAVYAWPERVPERMAYRASIKSGGKLKVVAAQYNNG